MTTVRTDTVTTERVGIVVYILLTNKGRAFSTAYFADHIGIQPQSVWDMLSKLSRVLPIVQDMGGWVIY
jgi:Mn-dependent DtxR family transcriptional regulator